MVDRNTLSVLLQREPFEPFSLRLSNGNELAVERPELAALGKSRLLIVDAETDEMEIINFVQLTEVRELEAG